MNFNFFHKSGEGRKARPIRKALSIASGVEPFVRAAGDVKATGQRLRAVAAEAFSDRHDRIGPHDKNGFKYTCWNPWGGSYLDENGQAVPVVDRASIPNFDELPGAKRGAIFGNDDFSVLMAQGFTEAQREEMITGSNVQRQMFVVAALLAVMCFAFLLMRDLLLPALSCLAPGVLFATLALKSDVFCKRVQDASLYGWPGYFGKYGYTYFLRIGN